VTADRGRTVREIERRATRMRRSILDMALAAGASSAHLGGALSMVEIAATLFGAVMKYDPRNPRWPERDRFILSKGHACLGYYAALADAGFLEPDDLATFEKTGSCLPGHPVINREKGIEFSTGSLGMGLSLGIGVALAAQRRRSGLTVYVVMGDGECNEGSVWEAAMAAAQFALENIVAGTSVDIMNIGDAGAKWRSFGWEVTEVDGHSPAALLEAFSAPRPPGRPSAVIAHTVKGKGCAFAEHNNDWHHAVLTRAQYDIAVAGLPGEDR
jgi:transketolase